MLKKIRVLLLVCITAVLVACGGGGGEETPNFAGTYQISAINLTLNTCGGSPTGSIAGGQDVVVQNGRNLSMSGGAVAGAIDADNGGFTTTRTQVVDGVTIVTTVNFRVTAAGASTFAVHVNYIGSVGSDSCTIGYTGTAVKIS